MLIAVLLLAGVAGVAGAGCGAAANTSPRRDPRAPGTATGDAGRAAAVVRAAFGANPKADSGHVSGTIDISVKGAPRFRRPIQLTMIGRFNDSPTAALANWDLLLGLEVRGLAYGAGMTAHGEKVYLNIGSTAFQVPDSTAGLMRATAAHAGNGLMKLLGAFGLRSQTWVRDPRIVGHEQVDGVDTIHVTSKINAARVFADAGRFTQLLTALRVTGLTNLPPAIGPTAQAALTRSVKTDQADLYAGASDHVPRQARMTMTIVVAPADRRALAGIASARVDVNLDVTEVGAAQTINVQPDQQSWAKAIPLLDAVAFGNRPAGQRGH